MKRTTNNQMMCKGDMEHGRGNGIGARRFNLIIVAGILLGLTLFALPTIIIDPYFHYHKPMENLEYPLSGRMERYLNDGIVKHFEYNALITGSSMTENFKTSELNDIFQVNAIKVPYSGATYKEIKENIERAVIANENLEMIIWGVDGYRLIQEKDTMRYDSEFYPDYLYNNCIFDDVKYILNKSILLGDTLAVINFTKEGGRTTTFDAYANWMKSYDFGKDEIIKNYQRKEKVDRIQISKEDYETIRGNLEQNITKLVAENPSIEFYLFFPPYSIYYWDSLNQEGTLERQLAAEQYAIEFLIKYDNVHLFAFSNEFEMICNPDNYKDYTHYGEGINSQMLIWMKEGVHRLTRENYKEYCNEVRNFYTRYDYESLF